MADERLELEIVLDDGSVLKGFSKIQNEAKQTGKTVKESFDKDGTEGIGNFVSAIRGKALIALGAAASAGYALKKALDFAEQAENVKIINNQFDMLSKRAGVAGDALKSALIGFTEGEVATTEILQAANQALIELGDNAAQLPQIMGLARQASLVFGGDIVERFSLINQAIASGNTRSLRQIGLFIDQDQALKNYAQTLGVATSSLNMAGRQQAILNAVLEKGKVAFEGITDTKVVTSAFDRLRASFKNLTDSFALAFNSVLGPVLEQMLNSISSGFEKVSNVLSSKFGNGADQASAKIKLLSNNISSLEAEIKKLQGEAGARATGFGLGGIDPAAEMDASVLIQQRTNQLTSLRAELQRLRAEEERQIMLSEKRAGATVQTKAGRPMVDEAAEAKRRAGLETQLNTFRSNALAAQETYFQGLSDSAEKVQALDYIANQRRLQLQIDYQARLNEINANADFSDAQRKLAREQLELEHNNKILNIQDESTKRQKELQKDLNTTFTNGYKNVMVNAIAGFSAALVKGGKSFEDFGKNMLGMIGDLSIQLGTMILFAGQGLQQMVAANPAGSIMFGAALIALGGVLKAISSSGLSAGADNPQAVGSASPIASTEMTTAPETINQRAQTQVQVNIHGNILDRRESGLELVSVLNEYFSANDGRLVSVT